MAIKALPAFVPKWTGRIINYKVGAMSPIEHIFYRHGPASGFSRVGKFAAGTGALDVKRMVAEAARSGAVTYKVGSGGSIVHNFVRQIGTHADGSVATRLQVYFNEAGEILTAFPIK